LHSSNANFDLQIRTNANANATKIKTLRMVTHAHFMWSCHIQRQ